MTKKKKAETAKATRKTKSKRTATADKTRSKKAKTTDKTKSTEAVTADRTKGLMARDLMYPGNPFRLMRSLAEDMDEMFGNFGFESRFPRMPVFDMTSFDVDENELAADFVPPVEMLRQNGQVLVRTELPGLKKEDIDVEIADGCLTIKGERKNEIKEEKDGYFRTERSYGTFYRQLPLPESVKTEDAKAVFKDGVLEVVVTVPKAALKAQKLEITEGETEAKVATGR